jgi:hypothetical protein
MAKFNPPENEEERRAWIKRQKAKGVRAFKGRYGWTTSTVGFPNNPQTVPQQDHRRNVQEVTRRWHTLNDQQCAAWAAATANKYMLTRTGRRVRLSAYHLFVSLNVGSADLGLSLYDVPAPEPAWSTSPVAELSATFTGGRFSLKARVEGPLPQHILVYAAAPVRSGVRYLKRVPFLCLLPPPSDGWSDLTYLYVARYGVPKPDWAIWIRTCQHIDGWQDAPITLRARISVQAA